MSKNEIPTKCTQRFKGVENFLRRIAFNLGNSPSQTEVKIISCIPIDVTDLQQKIINLEKQLDEAKASAPNSFDTDASPPVVQTTLFGTHFSRPTSRHSSHHSCKPTETRPTHRSEQCEQCSLKRSRSGIYSPPPRPSSIKHRSEYNQCPCHSSDVSNRSEPKSEKRGLFRKTKKKKPKKKDKMKTQFVYYAQTTTSPFKTYLETQTAPKSPREGETISQTYFTEMVRKQYAPVPMAQNFSIGDRSSQFSSPVCRDVECHSTTKPYESDLCSCCHGAFHNIDQHMATHNYTDVLNTFPTCSFKECLNNTSFYDTSLYDMVPVRERPARTESPYFENPKRQVPKTYASCHHPEINRSQKGIQPLITNRYAKTQSVNYTKRAPVKIQSKKERVRPPRRNENKLDRLKQADTSNSCCIDCGNVYMKRLYTNNKTQPSIERDKSALYKNAECLTNTLNDTECQTTTTQSVQIDQNLLEEKKTEETLNQIKNILQSVLTEVKTNTQLKNTTEVKEKTKKDAVVQKGTSQGHMPGCSSLLHSFTYSPYNMNPYTTSCSRQMNPGACCFQNLPYPSAKCMQNFPVFIQTPGRHMCASCYRNSTHVPRAPPPKPAATTATNTESKERNKETEKLIKEIYKSMAVNMEYPTKDTSASEYNDMKSTPRLSVNKSLYRPSVLDDGMRKFMKANASRSAQKSTTPITTMNSKLMSNTLSMRSQIVSTTDTERNFKNRRIHNYLENVDVHKNRQHKIDEEREYEERTPETTASDEEESFSDASVNEVFVQVEEPVKKPNKIGLFSKMLNSVKLFNGKSKKKKEEQIQVHEEEEEESDGNSDDYQTIYSQRVDRRPRYVPHVVRSPYRIKAHSKISYSRHMRDRNQERSKRPYMEQEYRRHWNERLMFHENRNKYSSDSPFSRETQGHVRNPVYWQDYEARSALVNVPQVKNREFQNPTLRPEITREDLLRSINNVDVKASKAKVATKGLAWLKKHKVGIRCGDQWKKLILEG